MKPILYIFLIYFLWSQNAMAFWHQGAIRGVVYEKNTKQPIIGANVVLVNTDRAVATDVFGNYQFSDLPAGDYEIKISYIGFDSQIEKVSVKDNETTTIQSYLNDGRLELAEITVTAPTNRFVNANTISQLDVKLRPINNSQDILRIVPGLFIAQHAGGGKAEQIFLRGFDIDHGTDINLSVDGMPVNMVSHAHGQGYADLHFVIPETVGEINFQKGPYYARYGNLATAGFVDFQTKSVIDRSMIKLEVGQFDTRRVVGMLDILGKNNPKQSAYIASEYFYSNNFFDAPQNFNRLNVLGKYRNQLTDRQLLEISLSTFTSKWDASGQVPERAVRAGLISRFGGIDNTEGGNTSRSNVSLKLLTFLNENTTLINQIFYSKYDFELYSNFTFFLSDPINGDQIRQKESRNIYGYRGNLNWETDLGKVKSMTEIGWSLRYDQVKNSELSRTLQRKINLSPVSLGDIDETNLSIYFDQNFILSPKLTLNAGLRWDNFGFAYANNLLTDSTFVNQAVNKSTLNPKLNLYYDLTKNVRLFVNSGTGFHSNDARVVVAQNGREILPRAYGAEVGATLKPFKNLILTTALWALDLDQEFVYVGDEGVVEPSGKTRRRGVDVALRYQFLNNWYLDADVNWTEPRARGVAQGEDFIPLAPVWSSTGGLSWKFKNGFNGSVRFRYLGDRPANENNSVIAKGFLLADLVFNYSRPRYELSLQIQNLLNREWKEAQFDTESRLKNEAEPVSEIHFTPGTPFFLKAGVSYFF
jgi:outer membrane receptor protein involved in Fe transport